MNFFDKEKTTAVWEVFPIYVHNIKDIGYRLLVSETLWTLYYVVRKYVSIASFPSISVLSLFEKKCCKANQVVAAFWVIPKG